VKARSAPPAAGLALVVAAACSGDPAAGPVCAPALGEAVSVVAFDARTGTVLPAAGSRGVVADGAFVDSLRPELTQTPVSRTLVGGGDRAGVYRVVVQRDGYAQWRRDGVGVARGACGIVTGALVAELEPAP
jgi:hypothetical protein